MLVLTRKVGERVVVGNGIVVHIIEVSGQRTRLGIEAPLEVAIRREELSARSESAPHRLVEKPR